MIEWEVRLNDGRVLNSCEHEWPAGQAGVLTVRVWNHPVWGDMVLWGDAYYGHPASLAMEGRLPDDEFARVLEEAQAASIAPSKRGL